MASEKILRKALEEIVQAFDDFTPRIIDYDSYESGRQDGLRKASEIAETALKEADAASPWIEITLETMPEDDKDFSRPTYEIANEFESVICNRIDGIWTTVNPRVIFGAGQFTRAWPDCFNHQPTHYREIEMPPLPGSETE